MWCAVLHARESNAPESPVVPGCMEKPQRCLDARGGVVTLAETISTIEHLCGDATFSFVEKCAAIEDAIAEISADRLLEHLDEAGLIPERFDHDSTEEKLFAKYCDALLTRSLRELGLNARLIEERADAADVLASYGSYKLVGDAKAFRLSRTAKNQKDFKVEALNQWRKGADYACLVCPLYQYPVSNSQIYQQARAYNVTLLSYTHLAFVIRHRPDPGSLQPLWEVAKGTPAGKSAGSYWSAVTQAVNKITGTNSKDWDAAVEGAAALLPRQAAEQIDFWDAQKARIVELTADAARLELITALKIESKIAVIKNSVAEIEATKETFES